MDETSETVLSQSAHQYYLGNIQGDGRKFSAGTFN